MEKSGTVVGTRSPRRDWSSLPHGLLEEIFFKRQLHLIDYVHLRSVCADWRSFALLEIQNYYSTAMNIPRPLQLQFQSPTTPFLLIQQTCDTTDDKFLFFGLHSNTVRYVVIPKATDCKFLCSSSQGWLVFLENTSPAISILNPFADIQFQLPPLTTFPGELNFIISSIYEEYRLLQEGQLYDSTGMFKHEHEFFIQKLVLSPNPTPTNYKAMAIFNVYGRSELAFCESGQSKWSVVTVPKYYEYCDFVPRILDIMHHKGHFYVCTFSALYQLNGLIFTLVAVAPDCNCIGTGGNYLAELNGEIILLCRDRSMDKIVVTEAFRVYIIQRNDLLMKQIACIGDWALFVGGGSVICIRSPVIPANCIYFTKDPNAALHDSGIFNLKTNLQEPFPLSSSLLTSGSMWSRHVWFTPSL